MIQHAHANVWQVFCFLGPSILLPLLFSILSLVNCLSVSSFSLFLFLPPFLSLLPISFSCLPPCIILLVLSDYLSLNLHISLVLSFLPSLHSSTILQSLPFLPLSLHLSFFCPFLSFLLLSTIPLSLPFILSLYHPTIPSLSLSLPPPFFLLLLHFLPSLATILSLPSFPLLIYLPSCLSISFINPSLHLWITLLSLSFICHPPVPSFPSFLHSSLHLSTTLFTLPFPPSSLPFS